MPEETKPAPGQPKPLPDPFYINALKGFRTPPKEDLFASMLSIETEFNILKAGYIKEEDPYIKVSGTGVTPCPLP